MMQGGEWRLVKLLGRHHAAARQPVDDHLDEADLSAVLASLIEELRKRFLGSIAIQPYQRADEEVSGWVSP